jgi:IS5 family transposase
VYVAGQRQKNASRRERKRRRRRSVFKPKIGHLKRDHRLDRCDLAELTGDVTNAILATIVEQVNDNRSIRLWKGGWCSRVSRRWYRRISRR